MTDKEEQKKKKGIWGRDVTGWFIGGLIFYLFVVTPTFFLFLENVTLAILYALGSIAFFAVTARAWRELKKVFRRWDKEAAKKKTLRLAKEAREKAKREAKELFERLNAEVVSAKRLSSRNNIDYGEMVTGGCGLIFGCGGFFILGVVILAVIIWSFRIVFG